MLGSATTATPSLHTATTSATPSSPTRPSRLRGLSYLRNYTHNHLHRSEQQQQQQPPPPLTRSTSSPLGLPFSPSRSATPTQPPPSTSERGTQQHSAAPASTIQSGEHGWIPTTHSAQLTSTNTISAVPEPNITSTVDSMTRSRTSPFGPTASNTSARRTSGPELPEIAAMPSAMPDSTTATPGPSKESLPTIRFIPHVETRSSRPSLHFNALSRQLKTPDGKVKVGRYSERDSNTSDVVGFKSKVVSRRHCEFWCTDGQWYVKDVKSSSGTFLNHVRLSSPGVESRPYPVNDGDVVQLGIDFKGGEEVIFRCVKIRIECNRGWQKSLNNFNTSAHKRLLNSAKNTPKSKVRDSDAASVNSSECSICLNPVAPCQALFVAPCSHVWHYKCIRGLIHGPNYPNFLCPNCRFVADLEAEVEQPEEEMFENFTDADAQANGGGETPNGNRNDEPGDSEEQHTSDSAPDTGDRSQDGDVDEDLSRMLNDTSISSPTAQAKSATRADRSSSSALPVPSSSQPINISRSRSGQRSPSDSNGARSTTPTSHAPFALSAGPSVVTEGPMTPRNDAGPFVLDGSAGRDRIDSNLATQAVAEVSEPASPEEISARNWPL
ncbi:E3 ubiquitin-protein ligase DMA1 [Cercospora beticola]|uniref:E3 ubiquitin-protein ligase DMA1 n=1 Tax=Cercospora beticola TaxID=122368 RepID=A0A2G5I3K5_CERBT|nr:E3 ubiquitin-protein ligase DMA1 [Cercospora beticola]PIA99369.1 E3 ubiquitin-protein ligase DMA1 [Cercospora beticola]WPA99395.1 hypothetical protein RHO25_004012 [Cercospora beticola]